MWVWGEVCGGDGEGGTGPYCEGGDGRGGGEEREERFGGVEGVGVCELGVVSWEVYSGRRNVVRYYVWILCEGRDAS